MSNNHGQKLAGKIAVITGGSSGNGLATAKRFVEEGAHVVITGRREKELKEAAAFIGRNVTTVAGDVSRLEDLDRLYVAVKEKHGHIDVLFANAGAGTIAPLAAATEAHFDQTFDVNVKGGDVSRLEDLDRLYVAVKEKHGHIDVLVANSGAGTIAPLAKRTSM